MLSKQQGVAVMLEMQEAMNTKVHPQWRRQHFAWYRAIWVECAELLDHYGWKWWKKQQPDIEQIKLELVDIWHFGMSQLLLEHSSTEELIHYVANAFPGSGSREDFSTDLESFALYTLEHRSFDPIKFAVLSVHVGLEFDELYERYVGKNILNFFRQDNGYQDGTYEKIWGGREDNEHLVEIIGELNKASISFKDDLYGALSKRYRELR
jgi:dimeric dUTPase (all-alpha-NTP-PPase superfamily)